MTKAELIRKIAKRASVPDAEAKVFFEIFLKKSADFLKPGEAIFLKGFGHFQLRKGKIRNKLAGMVDSDSSYIDLMAYYPSVVREDEVTEEIIFNIPAIEYGNYNPLDSHFSLSIGRPVIPIQGVSSQDFFIPLTGLELRKLIEGRVDKLLKTIQVIKEYTKGNEVLIIDTDSLKSNQLEFNWNEVQTKNISDSILIANSKEVINETTEASEKEITWDLGNDIDKEIVEDSILDVEKEQPSIVEEENETDEIKTDWNFGITMVDEEQPESEESVKSEDKEIEQGKELVETDNDENASVEQNLMHEFEPDKEERFERVRSFSSYMERAENETPPDVSIYRSLRRTDTIAFDQFEPDTQVDEENLNNRMRIEEFDDSLLEEEKKLQTGRRELTESGYIKSGDEFIKEEHSDKEGSFLSGKKDNPSAKGDFISRREQREAYYSRAGVSPVFIVAIIIIVAIAIALYFYLTRSFVSSKNPEPDQVAGSEVIHPNIVERDYSVPVTYSDKNTTSSTKVNTDNTNSKVGGEVKTQVVSDKAAQKKGVEKEGDNISSSITFNNLPAPTDTAELHKNISFENGNYVVQLSSFRTKSVAVYQTAKVKKKGYDAFVEKAEVAGKGTWYRVKVKNFKSMREAEDFLLSNK
jgi:cell division septation protein DedD